MKPEDRAALERLETGSFAWDEAIRPGFSADVKTALRLARSAEGLAGALLEQHKWQCEAEGVFMFYVDPKTKKIDCCDISREYAESDMCEKTLAALALVHYRGNGGKGKDGGDE